MVHPAEHVASHDGHFTLPIRKVMKSALIILLATTITALALRPDDFMEGNVSRNIPNAMKRAKTTGKPMLWVIYDPTMEEMAGPQTKNEWCLKNCFFGLEATRKLAAEKTIQVFATSTQPDAATYWPTDRPSREPLIIITDPDGNLLHTLESNVNPKNAHEKLLAALK